MLKHIPRRSAVLALPVCVLALGISARTSTSQTFEEFTEVIEVQVPVNVVDKNGQPVRGLTAEDFEIFDGRTRQELTNFRVVDLDTIRFGGQVDEDGNWVEAPDRPLATSRGAVERAIPAEARRHGLDIPQALMFVADQPLLIERRLGSGRVLWCSTSADRDWSDWPQGRLFVPLVRQMMAYLTDQLSEQQSVQTAIVSKPEETAGIARSGETTHVRNLDPRESSMARVSAESFRKSLGLPNGEDEQASDIEAGLPAPRLAQRADEAWPLAMWLLLAVLAAETLLASRVHS